MVVFVVIQRVEDATTEFSLAVILGVLVVS